MLSMSTEETVSTASLPKQDQNRNNSNYNRNGRGARPENRGPRTEDRVRSGGTGTATGSTGGGGGGGGGFTLVLKNPYKVQRIRVQQEPTVTRDNRKDNARSSTDSKDDENRRPRTLSNDATSTMALPKKKSTSFTASTDDDPSESSVKVRPDFGSISNGRYLMISS